MRLAAQRAHDQVDAHRPSVSKHRLEDVEQRVAAVRQQFLHGARTARRHDLAGQEEHVARRRPQEARRLLLAAQLQASAAHSQHAARFGAHIGDGAGGGHLRYAADVTGGGGSHDVGGQVEQVLRVLHLNAAPGDAEVALGRSGDERVLQSVHQPGRRATLAELVVPQLAIVVPECGLAARV